MLRKVLSKVLVDRVAEQLFSRLEGPYLFASTASRVVIA
jgi:hypothetical protein